MASNSLPSLHLPLDDRPSDYESVVQKLKQRPPDELRQARKHHRRALKALRNGAYDALPDSTREQLIERFHVNLKALNEALSTDDQAGDDESPSPPSSSQISSSLFNKALTWLW